MNLDQLRKKLLAAARANPPGDHVPHAFEKRITALLQSRPARDPVTLWVRTLWRAVIPCAALMLLLGVWSFSSGEIGPENGSASTMDLDQQFEQTMLATAEVGESEEIW